MACQAPARQQARPAALIPTRQASSNNQSSSSSTNPIPPRQTSNNNHSPSSNDDIPSRQAATNNQSSTSSSSSINRIPPQRTSNSDHLPSSNDDIPPRQTSSDNHSAPSSSNNNILTSTASSDYFVTRKSPSSVWKYAKKSDNGKIALCQLCNYSCAMKSHSTSTIRYHLIHKHNKQDLIISSSPSSAKSSVSERFKREIHALCYNAIVIDHRPFNDLRKKGIMAIFNKLCPGIMNF